MRDGTWRGRSGYPTAEALVDGFFDFWEDHRSVMRVVDLATEEGDQRFRNIRTRLLNEVVVALAEVIARNRGRRHPPDLDPMATAGVLVAMLATVAGHRYGFEFWGIRTDDTRRSMARIVYTTVTGQKPPARPDRVTGRAPSVEPAFRAAPPTGRCVGAASPVNAGSVGGRVVVGRIGVELLGRARSAMDPGGRSGTGTRRWRPGRPPR